MNPTQLRAFHDELEKIALAVGGAEVGLLRRLGRGVTQGVKRQWHGFAGGNALRPTDKSLLEEAGHMLRHPRKATSTGWKGMGLTEKSLLTGLAGLELPDAARSPDKGKRFGSLLGSTLGWLAFRKTPIVANLVGSIGAGMAGGKVGDMIHRALRKPQRQYPGGR